MRGLFALALAALLLPTWGVAAPAPPSRIPAGLPASGDPFDAAAEALAWERAGLEPALAAALAPAFAEAARYVDGARQVLAALAARDPLERAVHVARVIDGLEGASAGPPVARHALPSGAAGALLATHGLAPSAEEARALAALDALPPGPRAALAEVLDAFAGFEGATRDAYARADLSALRAARAGGMGVRWDADPLALAGVDVAGMVAARARLLDAAVAFARAWPGSNPDSGCGALEMPPVLALDLAGCATVYADDYAFTLDVGGGDTYLGNAGGSNPRTVPCDGLATGGAAAAIDLAGDDRYIAPRGCGVNGGARLGAGFLVDLGGDDAYVTGCCDLVRGGPDPAFDRCTPFVSDCCSHVMHTYLLPDFPAYMAVDGPGGGVNGGGDAGVGFLLDAAGNDTYAGVDKAVNGGAFTGHGALLDLGGDDVYQAQDLGTNGAGWWGHAYLVDGGGRDRYLGGHNGTNGASFDGSGFFVDAGGDDAYLAGSEGTNGGSWGGVAVFVDAGGDDTYEAGSWGTNGGSYYGSVALWLDAGGDDAVRGGDYAVNGGSCSAAGALLDWDGDDLHEAGTYGTNGGGYVLGAGLLLDRAGSDVHRAGGRGANGGGFAGGAGLLLDVAGQDRYEAGAEGANGGAMAVPLCNDLGCAPTAAAHGLLLDGGGHDVYADGDGGSGEDVTVWRKGNIGSQVDVWP